MPRTLLLALVATLAAAPVAHAAGITVTVPAKTNIFGAGAKVPPDPGGGGAGGGGVLPVLVKLPSNAKSVAFSNVTGSVSCCGSGGPFNGPNGGTTYKANISAYGGISGVAFGRALFLLGVFIGNAPPRTPPPTKTATTTPLLGQVFYVGDGTSSGKQVQFTVPAGATRLYLGFADATGFSAPPGYFQDNLGSVKATVQFATAAAAGGGTYTCSGAQKKLLDSTNTGGVVNGGRPPSFITFGKAYCLTQITTYHWNNGQGAPPGTLSLKTTGQTIGPFPAKASAGQGGAKNVNWYANVSTSKPVVLNGVYSCVDSDPSTWSSNQQSHGTGFCTVYGVPAVKKAAAAPKAKTKSKPKAKPAAKPTAKAKTKAKGGKGKLSIKASPDNGNPPLTVTFTLSSPPVVQWRIDYGDGQSTVKTGAVPASITHKYTRAGDYKPKLTVLSSPTATAAQTATTSITVGTSLMSFSAKPTSGSPPLTVTFTLGTSVQNITTWSVDFGDGKHTGGSGKPPATVTHTYTSAGTYAVNFAVKPGSYAVVAAFAQVTVGGGTPPALSLSASPTSGTHPLSVTFSLSSTIPGTVVSWQLQFGDGQQKGAQGKPPATVPHTYAKAGTYLAYLIVVQQQQYGGVQYVVPRNGLAVTVR
ncbi:MAG: PKD domain-containing protein [Actinobacteria bacterium]|nr:PKD domain-containing protein [Actinomycetota bacterium]